MRFCRLRFKRKGMFAASITAIIDRNSSAGLWPCIANIAWLRTMNTTVYVFIDDGNASSIGKRLFLFDDTNTPVLMNWIGICKSWNDVFGGGSVSWYRCHN